MKKFRKTIKSHAAYWLSLLILVLVCNQGATLHVHSLEHHHSHGITHGADLIDAVLPDHDHKDVALAHLSMDESHADHHQQVLSETDVSPDSVLSKLFGKLLLAALLLVLLFTALLSKAHLGYCANASVSLFWRPHLVPPLRAPPVHSAF